MLKRVAIFSKDNNSRTREGVKKLVNEFYRRGIRIQIYQKSGDQVWYPEVEVIEQFRQHVSTIGNCLILF